jgi:hypothetical protein
MAVIPPNAAINRILAALGLENVRSLKINAAVNHAVTVVTEQYVTGSQLNDLATALETKEWVLVPKDAGRWIPVEERLPEEDEDVLVIEEDGGMLVANRNDRGNWGHSFGSGGPSDGRAWPTHWMPLPEPPAE